MKLTTKARNALPNTDFALPAQRKYPIQDASHAANAKSRAAQMADDGVISRSVEAKIDRKANKVLRGSK